MRLALVLGELSSALPLPSVALFPVSCALSCIMGKKSCNAKRASPITNSRLNGRSMRCVIYESNDFDQRQPELVLDCSRRGIALEARGEVRRTGSEPALHDTELSGFQFDLTQPLTGGDCHDARVALLACRIEGLYLDLVGS